MPANYRQVLPDRGVTEELSNQRIPIGLGFGKEQNPGRETINAMNDKGPLPSPLKFGGKQRPCGRRIGAFHRHSRKSRRLVQRYDGIVFIEHNEIARDTRHSPILPCSTATARAWEFLHGWVA
jgi:hypothetical protein